MTVFVTAPRRGLSGEVLAEIQRFLMLAQDSARLQRFEPAWAYLEAVHILGQTSTRWHVRSHAEMARLAWQCGDRRELIGQLFRLIGAAAITWVWIPRGNSGRARVSAFKPMDIPEDLASILARNR